MWHAHIWIHQIIHTIGSRIVLVKCSEIRIEVLRLLCTRDKRQVGWRSTKPSFGDILIHTDIHQRTELLVWVKQQVLTVKIFRDTQILRYAIVTRVLKRVTTSAIISVQRRTMLQRRLIARVSHKLVTRDTAAIVSRLSTHSFEWQPGQNGNNSKRGHILTKTHTAIHGDAIWHLFRLIPGRPPVHAEEEDEVVNRANLRE